MIRQGHDLIENTVGQFRQEIGGGREQNGRRLARHAADREDQPGDDVRESHRQQYAPDGLQFGRAERVAAVAQRVVDRAHRLFGRPDHDRQHEQGEGQRAGDDRVAESERTDEQRHAEQAEHDRRYAAQVARHDADHSDEPVVAGVFADMDARHHAERKRDGDAARHQAERADDSRQDASLGHPVFGHRGEKFPTDDAGSFDDDETQNPYQYSHDQQACQSEQPEGKSLRALLAFRYFRGRYHVVRSLLFFSFLARAGGESFSGRRRGFLVYIVLGRRAEIISTAMLSSSVSRNRMQPSMNSAS